MKNIIGNRSHVMTCDIGNLLFGRIIINVIIASKIKLFSKVKPSNESIYRDLHPWLNNYVLCDYISIEFVFVCGLIRFTKLYANGLRATKYFIPRVKTNRERKYNSIRAGYIRTPIPINVIQEST